MRAAKPAICRNRAAAIWRVMRVGGFASRIMMRSRIVLLAARGLQKLEIAEQMQITQSTVNRWRECFLKLGMAGLLKDAPMLGRTPSIPAAVVAQVIEETTQSAPANATHWSRSATAHEMGISDSTVGRIWHANGLKPHRVDSFKISNDPQFADNWKRSWGCSEPSRTCPGVVCG